MQSKWRHHGLQWREGYRPEDRQGLQMPENRCGEAAKANGTQPWQHTYDAYWVA